MTFGAHGIVYFDPFRYQVRAYARIAAGVTIDIWLFGEITISVSLGARIEVEGPDFHGRATFEVGPDRADGRVRRLRPARRREPLGAGAFIDKYLDAADDGGALAHAVMTHVRRAAGQGRADATPDGSSARPFVVVVEFVADVHEHRAGHRRHADASARRRTHVTHAPAEPGARRRADGRGNVAADASR